MTVLEAVGAKLFTTKVIGALTGTVNTLVIDTLEPEKILSFFLCTYIAITFYCVFFIFIHEVKG